MGDLRRSPQRLAELADFILSREGFLDYFYCDTNGFVTIGIGTLVPLKQMLQELPPTPACASRSEQIQTSALQFRMWFRIGAACGPGRDYPNANTVMSPNSVWIAVLSDP